MIILGVGSIVTNAEEKDYVFLEWAAKCQALAGSLLAGAGCVLTAIHWCREFKSK